jgi:hypothetical protein
VTLKIKIISDYSYVIGTFSSAIVNKVVRIFSFMFYEVKKKVNYSVEIILVLLFLYIMYIMYFVHIHPPIPLSFPNNLPLVSFLTVTHLDFNYERKHYIRHMRDM